MELWGHTGGIQVKMLYLRHRGKPLVAKIIHRKYAKLPVLNTRWRPMRQNIVKHCHPKDIRPARTSGESEEIECE
jgi:hypothetical protein